MKEKVLIILTTIVLVALVAMPITMFLQYWDTSADKPDFEGFYYNVENGQVTITDYHGESQHVVVPKTIDGMPVVKIKGWTFDDVDIVSL